MISDERQLWFTKAHRLEEDRLTLLRLLETLSETRLRLNGTAGGLAEAPEYLAVERRVMAELAQLNDRQNGYIAEMMAFEPQRDAESGRLGGLAGDLAFVKRSRTREAVMLNGRRAPVIASALLTDVERLAEQRKMSVRTWVERALRQVIYSGAMVSREETLTERIRQTLQEQPMTFAGLARHLDTSSIRVKYALDNLRRQGRIIYAGPRGGRNHLWVSAEEK